MHSVNQYETLHESKLSKSVRYMYGMMKQNTKSKIEILKIYVWYDETEYKIKK